MFEVDFFLGKSEGGGKTFAKQAQTMFVNKVNNG
jgi:hypothetical protein